MPLRCAFVRSFVPLTRSHRAPLNLASRRLSSVPRTSRLRAPARLPGISSCQAMGPTTVALPGDGTTFPGNPDVLVENMDIMERAEVLLRDRFGHDSFRAGQRDVMKLLLAPEEGMPARALAVFPTGAGKSLTYQLPALLFDSGVTLVVSPLLALMRDQSLAMQAKGIAAASLDSTLDAQGMRGVYADVQEGRTRMLFVAPERFKNERFLRILRRVSVALFVIDEAHCVSEWGHSFRPDYLRLARYADELGFERRLALTATATPKVAEDIARSLSIPFPQCWVRTPAARPNLSTRVTLVPSAYNGTYQHMSAVVKTRVDILADRIKSRPPGPTIVYVTLQATTNVVSEQLRKRGLIHTRGYHAGVDKNERKQIQDWFMESPDDESSIVVATIAFGMGIDKANIRYVYHANMPKSLESYTQEIGRAGRDGKPSVCEVLACVDDMPTLEGFALGATPSRASISRIVHELMDGRNVNDVVDISLYDASHAHDVRELVINQMLAQLDLNGGYIRETTPMYTKLRCRKKDVAAFKTAMLRNNVTGRILREGTGKSLLCTIDVKETATKLQIEYGAISRAMDDLVREGVLERVDTYKIRAQFIIYRKPDNLEEIVDMLYKAAKNMERQELDRLREVVEFLSASSCQSKILRERFGDKVTDDGDCGYCAFCDNGGKAAISIDDETRKRVGRALDERRWALVLSNAELPRNDPVLMARFAAGISSPRISKLYRKLPGYGTMSDHAFDILVDAAKRECAK